MSKELPLHDGLHEDAALSNHPVPPPFNPIGSAPAVTTQAECASHGDNSSVVPDLMRVYESLTQSSTPQIHHSVEEDGTLPAHQQQCNHVNYSAPNNDPNMYHPFDFSTTTNADPSQQAMDAAAAAAAYAAPFGAAWTYDTTSVPAFHPAHHTAYSQMQDVPAPTNSTLSAPPATGVSTDGTNHNHDGSAGSRSLRKRPAPSNVQHVADSQQQQADASANSQQQYHHQYNSRGSKSRRKGKDPDGRWSKRFTWPEDLHRDFCSAVFDVGLKHASPSSVMEHMPVHAQITSERIKSHLQKYRLHRQKSKKDFMTCYDATVANMQKEGLSGITALSGGQVPAHLTHVTMHEDCDPDAVVKDGSATTSATTTPTVATPAAKQLTAQQDALVLPRLTEKEKQSPMGASMGYLMGLFFSLKQQLMVQRAAQAAASAAADAAKNQPVAAVFDSFVSGRTSPTQLESTVSAAGIAAPAAAGPSARSNLEENNMMKREMQNQMAFQNKMRALKMQELNKSLAADENEEADHHYQTQQQQQSIKAAEAAAAAASEQQQFQGTGEAAAGGDGNILERNRSLSIGVGSDDFWNTDVVDDQLFEFLMNN